MSSSVRPRPPVDPARAAESNLVGIMVPLSTFTTVAAVAAGLRLYTRTMIKRTAGKDDIFLILAVLGTVGGLICFIVEAFHGLGRHQDALSHEDGVWIALLNIIFSIISSDFGMGALKFSVAFSLLRLSSGMRWFQITIWSLMVFVGIYSAGAFLTFVLYCNPLPAAWDRSVKGHCYSLRLFINFAVTNTACNIVTDVAFATLPIPVIWKLHMKRRTRLYLVGVFSLGYLTVGLGVAKAVYQIGFTADPDKTFGSQITVLAYLQLCLGITTACIPTLKPLLGGVLKLSGSRNSKTPGPYAHGFGYGSKRSRGNKASKRDICAIELDDGYIGPQSGEYRIQVKSGHTTSLRALYPHYVNDGDRSGSEEMILHRSEALNGRGIVRTVEVSVER